LTSCWLLPQKEQYKTFSLELPFFSAMDLLVGSGVNACWDDSSNASEALR
jgi:hypothetical protein